MTLLKYCLFFTLALVSVCNGAVQPSHVQAEEYRVDYEWSEQAVGWLKYHPIPTSWNRARVRCLAEGAILASPLTYDLKKAIVSFVQKQKGTNFEHGVTIFSGVHATFSEGVYTSIEGVPLFRLAIDWEADEPDNVENSERCLAMRIVHDDGVMSDTRCERMLPYVCYKKYAKLNMTECGTADPEYVLEPRTGSCYKFHKKGLPWSEAFMVCDAEGGHLAIIDDDVEDDVITDILARHPEAYVEGVHKGTTNIGYRDWGSYGASFMTIHGDPIETKYSSWSYGNPNNDTSTVDKGQYCGAVFRSGLLDDNFCSTRTAFLCEKTPDSLLKYP